MNNLILQLSVLSELTAEYLALVFFLTTAKGAEKSFLLSMLQMDRKSGGRLAMGAFHVQECQRGEASELVPHQKIRSKLRGLANCHSMFPMRARVSVMNFRRFSKEGCWTACRNVVVAEVAHPHRMTMAPTRISCSS